MSARKLAVQLLNRTEQEQSYSNLLLDSALSQSQLDERDKRLCASLYYGVIERRITLDAVLSHYSKQPLRKLDSTVWNILRLGIYQLLYCDQIPSRAASFRVTTPAVALFSSTASVMSTLPSRFTSPYSTCPSTSEEDAVV